MRVNWSYLIFILFLSLTAWHEVPFAFGQDSASEDIEMLEIFEVPGTAVIRKPRNLVFPRPGEKNIYASTTESFTTISAHIPILRPAPPKHMILDPVGKARSIRSSVKPLQAKRPPYPRFAREQGWHGTTVLRITIETSGTVSSISTQKSSGFPILDDSASRAVKEWVFSPAKDGEFAVASTVDIPIRFDLDQPD